MWSHREGGPGYCSISNEASQCLNVYFDIKMSHMYMKRKYVYKHGKILRTEASEMGLLDFDGGSYQLPFSPLMLYRIPLHTRF